MMGIFDLKNREKNFFWVKKEDVKALSAKTKVHKNPIQGSISPTQVLKAREEEHLSKIEVANFFSQPKFLSHNFSTKFCPPINNMYCKNYKLVYSQNLKKYTT